MNHIGEKKKENSKKKLFDRMIYVDLKARSFLHLFVSNNLVKLDEAETHEKRMLRSFRSKGFLVFFNPR